MRCLSERALDKASKPWDSHDSVDRGQLSKFDVRGD